MSMSEGVTVLLPVSRAEPRLLERAFTCVQSQTHERLEILLVLNGADEQTRDCASRLCASDGRAWMVEIEVAQLAGALNVGLSEARHELVARMDADDCCDAERVARQVEAMRALPTPCGPTAAESGRGSPRRLRRSARSEATRGPC